MLHSSQRVYTIVVLLGALLTPVSLWGADSDSLFKARRFLVDSTPAGADVFVIGGKLGKTPIRLSERDIYPNWYPDEQAHLYGIIILRKTGCNEFSKRLTLDDIDNFYLDIREVIRIALAYLCPPWIETLELSILLGFNISFPFKGPEMVYQSTILQIQGMKDVSVAIAWMLGNVFVDPGPHHMTQSVLLLEAGVERDEKKINAP